LFVVDYDRVSLSIPLVVAEQNTNHLTVKSMTSIQYAAARTQMFAAESGLP